MAGKTLALCALGGGIGFGLSQVSQPAARGGESRRVLKGMAGTCEGLGENLSRQSPVDPVSSPGSLASPGSEPA